MIFFYLSSPFCLSEISRHDEGKSLRMVIVPEYLFFPERIFAPDRSDYSETRKERIKGLLPVHPIMRERWMTHTLTNSCSYMTHSVRGERVAMMKETNSYSYMIHRERERDCMLLLI